MEMFFGIIGLALYIFLFSLLLRTVRAIEKIADKIEQIPDNETTRE